ncbi:MAG: gamma-glutamyltransferase [Chitinophagaceae bacterium]
MNKNFLLLLLVYFIVACNPFRKNDNSSIDPYHYVTQKTITADNGAVVTAHALASKVGVQIFQQGGNAIDAAIAVQFTLAVVFPGAGNIGGGGFLVARLSDGKEITLDFREMAPAKSYRDMYIDSNGNARTDWSQAGHLSSGVPGVVAGMFALMKYAKLSFDKLIQPAIDFAEKGFVIDAREADGLNGLQGDLIKYNTVMPVFVKNSGWKAGDTLIQTDLANTLKRIKEKGAAGFYEGETARLIVEEMKRANGIISYEDLKNYKAIFREPHVFYYKGYKVIGMPMPSSSGLLINQMMKMVEKKDIGKMGFQSADATQLMIEAERRAFADRAEYMGDADYYKVPVKVLSSDKYLDDRMKDYEPGKAGTSTTIQPGNTADYESSETTHFSIADKYGNMVSVTTTLNDTYGSRTVVGGAGFILNDEMDDFSIKPGTPNMFGAVGGEANAVHPGKRMLSSMSPTLVLKDNKPFLVAGTKGGTTIPTSIFQTLVNIIDFGMSTEDAVNKSKFHHQWLPDEVEAETGFPMAIIDSLKKMGYKIKPRDEIGRTEVIKILPNGKLEAVGDRRGDDDAEGW